MATKNTKAKNTKANDKTNETKAKAEDKAVATKNDSMTKAQITEVLESIGVVAPKKALKDDLLKLMGENQDSIDMMARVPENKKACIIKAFGAHGSNALCVKCKKKQVAVYNDCAAFQKITGAKKAAAKKTRKMGHRTGTAIWGTRNKTAANKFCRAVLRAGEDGITMAEARKAKWNPKGYPFKETAGRLVDEGLAELKDGRYFVTAKGIEESGSKKSKAA